jgi:hypothetical protein
MLLSRLYLTSASLISLRVSRACQACVSAGPFRSITTGRSLPVSCASSFSGAQRPYSAKAAAGGMANNPYEPFLLSPIPGAERNAEGELHESEDWTADLVLETARQFAETGAGSGGRLRVLVLYGSLRERSVLSL